jgi:hypothetical protein
MLYRTFGSSPGKTYDKEAMQNITSSTTDRDVVKCEGLFLQHKKW